LRPLCRVGGASLRVPDLEAVPMKTIQPPVRTTKKAHWLIGRDRRIAAIALVPEARTAPPELNRVRSWKQAASDPMSNEFTSDTRNHDTQHYIPATPIESAFGTSMNLLTPSYLSAPDLIATTPQRFAWLNRLANSRQGSRVSRSSRDSRSMSEPGRGLL